LNVGDDICDFPQRIRRDRTQADGPVASLATAGRPHDVELHVPAQRMPIERVADPNPDLVNAYSGFCKECVEFQGSAL